MPANPPTDTRSIDSLKRLLEWYGSQEVEIRADLDAGRKGLDWESEWMRYKSEADALRAGIAALEQPHEPAAEDLDALAVRIRKSWEAYRMWFGESPNGSLRQIRAMLEFGASSPETKGGEQA